MKFENEQIDENHSRISVPGGWLVKAFEDVTHNTESQGRIGGWDFRVAMAFVPDPLHLWVIEPSSNP